MILEKCTKILDKHKIPSCHSNFQIRNFILGKESSDIGKFWQCIRELQARQETLQALETDYQDLQDNIEIAKLDLEEIQLKNIVAKNPALSEIRQKKRAIQTSKQKRNIDRLYKTKQSLDSQRENILKEMKVLVEEFEKLSEFIPYKEFDDESAQLQYWTQKFEKELVLTQTLGLPPNPELLKSCLALPSNSALKKNIEEALVNANKKLLKENN
jgi:hypothetical protein